LLNKQTLTNFFSSQAQVTQKLVFIYSLTRMVPSPAPLTFQSHVEGLNPPKKLKQNKTKNSSTNKFTWI